MDASTYNVQKATALLGVAYLLSFTQFGAAAESDSQSIKGDVVDSLGAAVQDTLIEIHEERAARGQPPTILFSDKAGSFSSLLKPGFKPSPGLADICAMAVGFTPVCRKIYIETKAQVLVRFELKVDPLGLQHNADTFPTSH